MTAIRPAVSLRHRLGAAGIEIVPAMTVVPGRAMWCRGRKVLAFVDVDKITAPFPNDADTLCVASVDYERLVGAPERAAGKV